MSSELIYETLELVADRAGDISRRCYDRFFEYSPEGMDLMVHMDDLHRGKMMDEIFRLLLTEDFEAEQSYLNWEVVNHQMAYSVVPETYDPLFQAVLDTVREIVADDWSEDAESAWQQKMDTLSGEIKRRFK